ncbi:hypothetical protein CONCODRAFT_14511 [Conidiobolus coronatus NRRL 28638]|uniref:GST N-terminal domain-containing protein n=1 Tax=Conidiobolus coronatus (strain ATCC 28846 / CBS 209.66 / NRRL 28638) TaxID=796925 RepID=A0A137PIC5_CONC2|nr:hypothetical protein CONCODRAFT_14511 [Conidiobolus coronatus NRRL 28638]|eukprot:KXN74743.1 hypothetical protein CONCODRAFT_14511 [Conidiobolus coronatus NRRL 28638]
MSNNKIKFYQVEAHPKRLSFSPFVIATELFLKHKNLDWDAKLLKYSEVKSTVGSVTNGKWGYVPTLKFPNGDVAFDSLKIAEYLDEKYPSNPLIYKSEELDKLTEHYDQTCNWNACKMNVKEFLSYMDDKSRKYFMETRVPMLQSNPDGFKFNQEENIAEYFENLKPVIQRLEKTKFIDGDKPLIHDYLIISRIQMVKTTSPEAYHELVENNPSEIFKKWVERMDGLFDDFLKNRKTILTN